MEFTRHARNGMRRLGLTRAEVAAIILRSDGGDRVELIAPGGHLDLLARAAERYDLDAEAIEAAARSALAAPDRTVLLDVLARESG